MIKYIVMAATAIVVAGCAATGPTGPKETVVNANLWNAGTAMAIITDKDKIPAGKVTFRGANTSTDETAHEMLVLKVDTDLPNLPYDESTGRVPEDQIESLGEIPEIEPGVSDEVTLDLAPGTYLLFCNKPGHFALNMKTLIHVQ